MLRKIRSFISMVLVIALCLQITPLAASVTQFSDVPSNHWAYEGIAYVVSQGFMGETQDGLFEPDSTANRGMIITVLYRLAGQPSVNATSKPFSDVELGVWYSNPIIWAKNIGIIDGHDDGTFRPTNTMPREQIALIMYRYAQTLNYDVSHSNSDYTKFPDFSSTPAGCQPAMKWAIKKDMLIGRADNNLHPNAAATRAELATCVYRFVTNNRHLSGISLKESSKNVNITWSGKIGVVYNPNITTDYLANPKITWSSSNTSVVTVNSQGTITAVGIGSAIVTATSTCGGFTSRCTINVGPSVFRQLKSHNVITLNNIQYTNDGMYILNKSIADILNCKGISSVQINGEYVYFDRQFDDWYLYAIQKADGSYTYGLYKMREQEDEPEDEGYDNDDPGVTISFVSFNSQALIDCLTYPSVNNLVTLYEDSIKSTGPDVFDHDDGLAEYFTSPNAKGPYLIAENYVQFIANESVNGQLDLSDNYNELLNSIDFYTELINNPNTSPEDSFAYILLRNDLLRVPNALRDLNTQAGRTIYDEEAKILILQNKNNLSLYEKQAILAAFCGNVKFISFAAEVEFHADAIYSWPSDIDALDSLWYNAAIRADMSLGETEESGFYDPYYNLNSDIVSAHRNIHGDY